MVKLLAAGAAAGAVSGALLYAAEIEQWASLVMAMLRYVICELLTHCPAAPVIPDVGA